LLSREAAQILQHVHHRCYIGAAGKGALEKIDQLGTSSETLIRSSVRGTDGINGSKVPAGADPGTIKTAGNRTAKGVSEKVLNRSSIISGEVPV
jgi:hypothetical protein